MHDEAPTIATFRAKRIAYELTGGGARQPLEHTQIHTHSHISAALESTIALCVGHYALFPVVMDVTLCDTAKCVLEMCLELLCGAGRTLRE